MTRLAPVDGRGDERIAPKASGGSQAPVAVDAQSIPNTSSAVVSAKNGAASLPVPGVHEEFPGECLTSVKGVFLTGGQIGVIALTIENEGITANDLVPTTVFRSTTLPDQISSANLNGSIDNVDLFVPVGIELHPPLLLTNRLALSQAMTFWRTSSP